MLLLGRRDRGLASIYSMGPQPSTADRMLGLNNMVEPEGQPSASAFVEMAAEMLIDAVEAKDPQSVAEALRTAFAALEMSEDE